MDLKVKKVHNYAEIKGECGNIRPFITITTLENWYEDYF